MTAFDIYLLMMADGIKILFIMAGVVSSILFGVMWTHSVIDRGEEGPSSIKKSFFASLFVLFIGIFTPSTKTLTAMYVVPPALEVLSSDRAMALGDKTLTYLENFLDKYVDTEPKK